MFTIFKVKTKLQYQVEDYLRHKKERGVDVSDTIVTFVDYVKKCAVEEILPDDIQNFYLHLKEKENTKYFISQNMKDVRVMFRWFKARKHNVVEPDIIGEEGLTNANINAIMEQMEAKVRIGRPPKVELIKKVKSLRDTNKLSYREIARVLRKDVSQVYVWYKYDLTK
jgi:arsenate reductase-like glutaredoxin family protein